MKLLIVCQAVDSRHSNLGFFVRWIAEFAKYYEQVHVIANEVGEYDLPKNVHVHSLGKEKGVSRIGRYWRFVSYMIRFSNQYDQVFCHMNPEFVLAGGWWWRLTGKCVGFWYMHKSVTIRLKCAERLADVIFTASPESFRLSSTKLNVVGHGIDTDIFKPDSSVTRGTHALSVGRLTESKHHDKAIMKAKELGVELRIAGEGPEREYLEYYAQSNNVRVTFLGGLTHEQLQGEYLRAALFIHTSLTGSLDKVLLEAMACGTPIYTEYEIYKEYQPQSFKVLIPKIVSAFRAESLMIK